MNKNMVVLVDEKDEPVGLMEKMEAHQKGLLHRAVSVFIFNSKGEWLLQQRAAHKYHSPLLWSNTACTHPYQNETNLKAARRRLFEEMSIRADLNKQFSFIYKAHLDRALIEHELDHIFFGFSDQLPVIDPKEVISYRYISQENLEIEIKEHPNRFSEWFKLLFARICKELVL